MKLKSAFMSLWDVNWLFEFWQHKRVDISFFGYYYNTEWFQLYPFSRNMCIYVEYHNRGRKIKRMQFFESRVWTYTLHVWRRMDTSKKNSIACVNPLRIGTYMITSIAIIVSLVNITLYY